jgi:uroporphyrin-III C-methyltransferase
LTHLESVRIQGPSLVVVGKYLETLNPKAWLESMQQQIPDASLLA